MINQIKFNTPECNNPLIMACKTLDKLHEGVLFFNKMKMIQDLGMQFANEQSKQKQHYAIYECPFCGKHFKCLINNIKRGLVKSCGCNRFIAIAKSRTKHNLCKTTIYYSWTNMKSRCYNVAGKSYKDYGERGITVCDEWKNSFINFYNWSIKNGYREGLTIDRENNDKGYTPENCRWVTIIIQANNKRVIQSNNTSGFRGVRFYKRDNNFRALLYSNNKQILIGTFSTAINAAIARNEYIIKNKLPHPLNIIPTI